RLPCPLCANRVLTRRSKSTASLPSPMLVNCTQTELDATGRRSRLGTWPTRNGLMPAGQVGELWSDFYVCQTTADGDCDQAPFAGGSGVPARRCVVRLDQLNSSLVLYRVDDKPRLRTDHSIHGNVGSLLQQLARRLGLSAVASVNTADFNGVAAEAHQLLRTTNRKAGRAYTQNGLTLVGLINIAPGHLADDSVDRNALLLLERFDCSF